MLNDFQELLSNVPCQSSQASGLRVGDLGFKVWCLTSRRSLGQL